MTITYYQNETCYMEARFMGRKAVDYLNKQIGNVIVIGRAESAHNTNHYARWRCRCICGKQFEIASNSLKKAMDNPNYSCGCIKQERPKEYSSSRLIDLTKQNFKWLTILQQDKEYYKIYNKKQSTYWRCKCACGNICIKQTAVLNNNELATCGCYTIKEDLSNKVFHDLTVLQPDFQYRKQHDKQHFPGVYWLCKCKCGNLVTKTTNYLLKTQCPSCDECKKHIVTHKKYRDLTGKQFNYLTVLERDWDYKKQHNITTGVYWKCQCICGNIKSVRVDCLIKGTIKSCGCMQHALHSQIIDMTNQRYGNITVLEPDLDYVKNHNLKNSGNITYWKYKCDCGTIHTAPGTEIRSGKVICCPNCNLPHGEYIIKQLLQNNNIKFIHNDNYFKDLKSPITGYYLRYDFIILNDNNIPQYLIQFDGEQHFCAVNAWGGNERYKRQQEYDEIKNEYARAHNLPLIRIPYNYLKNLKIEDLKLQTSNFINNN